MNDELTYENDLVDMFAMAAMQELLRDDLPKSVENQMGYQWACKYAYIIADEMMKARNAYHTSKTA